MKALPFSPIRSARLSSLFCEPRTQGLARAALALLRCSLAVPALLVLSGCAGGWGGLLTIAPTIVTQPVSLTVTAGQPAAFTVVATGSAPLAYQWFNGSTAISGATSATYAISATVTSNSGSVFTVTVSNSAGSVTSNKVTLTVNAPSAPLITTQPVSATICPGGTLTLSVVATYAASYQWSFNGNAISGATNASYVVTSAAAGNTGSYTVAVSNSVGTVTSTAASVQVGASLTTNPISLSISVSQTATFSVSATGTPPFSFQWYVIASGSTTGTAISGATSNTYTTAPVTTANNGSQYYATVVDGCNAKPVVSTTATLTVTSGNVPPTITLQPVSQAVAVGSTTATFTVAASGTPTLTYQWYRVPAGSVAGTALSGATSASYTLPSSATTTSNDQDQYYAMVSNSYGHAVSIHATLAVGAGILIQIANQPKTLYVNAGATAAYSVTATSTVPLSYQWYVAAPGSSTFTAISGATSSTYTFSSTTLSQSGSVVYVTVSNGSTASVNSNSAGLFVGALNQVGSLCNSTWTPLGNAVSLGGTGTNCSYELTGSVGAEHGEIVWDQLISTGNIQLAYTITVSYPSTPPADGFAMVLGDPSLGATPASLGQAGQGLGAEDIPGFVLGFDTFENPGDPPVPYLGVGRGEDALWENPWVNVNTNIPPLAVIGGVEAHNYTVSIVNGLMTVTMDGSQVFSGSVSVPPVAYLYFTASTGLYYEEQTISNLTATVTVPTI